MIRTVSPSTVSIRLTISVTVISPLLPTDALSDRERGFLLSYLPLRPYAYNRRII
jgi:hypothetical protein